MRQVLIEDNGSVFKVGHNQCIIQADKTYNLTPGMNRISLPFPLKVVSGGEISFYFTVAGTLAEKGILLAAARQDGDRLDAILYNLSNETLEVINPEALLRASAYETVNVQPVKGAPAGVALFDFEGKAYNPDAVANPRAKLNAKKARKGTPRA